MQKILTQLEFKVANKFYHFICDPDSPTAHAKEALELMLKHVESIEEAVRENQAQENTPQEIQEKVA